MIVESLIFAVVAEIAAILVCLGWTRDWETIGGAMIIGLLAFPSVIIYQVQRKENAAAHIRIVGYWLVPFVVFCLAMVGVVADGMRRYSDGAGEMAALIGVTVIGAAIAGNLFLNWNERRQKRREVELD